MSWTARAGICSWRWTGPLAAWPPQGEARRGRGTGTRQFLPVFLLLFAGAPPTGHDSVDSQAGCRCRRLDFDPSQRPSPRADPDFFTGARARVCVCVCGRSLGWKRHPRSWVAAGLGRREVRRMGIWLAGPGLQVADESGWLAFQLTRWPLLTATGWWRSRSCSCSCTGWFKNFR